MDGQKSLSESHAARALAGTASEIKSVGVSAGAYFGSRLHNLPARSPAKPAQAKPAEMHPLCSSVAFVATQAVAIVTGQTPYGVWQHF